MAHAFKKDSIFGALFGASIAHKDQNNHEKETKHSKNSTEQEQERDPKLTDDKIQGFKSAFKLFDRDGDGKITKEDLVNFMNTWGRNPSDAELKFLFEAMDNDCNGSVDFYEFLKIMSKETRPSKIEEELNESFKLFDRDGKGYITENELRNIMINIGETLSESELDEMIKLADVNQDGKINYEEFVKMMTEM